MMLESAQTPSPAGAGLDLGMAGGALMQAMINQIECGLLACDGAGGLLFANRAARRALDDGQALALRDRVVICPAQAHGSEFAAALRDATDRRRARLLQLGGDPGRTMVAVTPIWTSEAGQRVALVMIGRRLPGSALALQMLSLRHGLTQAETRVLASLLTNMPPREIAESHGVGIATVRTQIQSVRHKLGARSIEALLLQVAALPPIMTAVH